MIEAILSAFRMLLTGTSGKERANFEALNTVSMSIIEKLQAGHEKLQERLDKVEEDEKACHKRSLEMTEQLIHLKTEVEKLKNR